MADRPNMALVKLNTLRALGVTNLARVGTYRAGLKTKLHPAVKLKATLPEGPFFARSKVKQRGDVVASQAWRNDGIWFSKHRFPLDGPPDWHANPFRPGARANDSQEWHNIPDFAPALGDIKTVWEASRFDWVIAMAQRAALGDEAELDRLNAWLEDWARKNPAYRGVNWKCGQEASIRVMHLAAASLILDQATASEPALREFLRVHLARIAPTIDYAIGQANNHGTSEAVALFIGGHWLGGAQGEKWATLGRRWLEDRSRQLIEQDGTFSQYSFVYHRLMLDSFALAEIWRRKFELPKFSAGLYERLRAATLWLHGMTAPEGGDVPNMGTNDGARLLPLVETDFRDFRPSLQLAAALFANARAVEAAGLWDQPLAWLDVDLPTDVLPKTNSRSFDNGGFHALRAGNALAVLRYPRFRYRPGQADALHLDLWNGDRNLLSDAGTFSYASDDGAWFAGTSAHNTVEFDGHDQMPRLGRFLFGAWLKAEDVAPVEDSQGTVSAAAAYRDAWGNRHHRQATLTHNSLQCVDQLSGKARKAVLRWRLARGDWTLTGDSISDGNVTLRVTSDGPLTMRLTQAPVSRYYLQQESLPVLEVETAVPNRLVTQVSFS